MENNRTEHNNDSNCVDASGVEIMKTVRKKENKQCNQERGKEVEYLEVKFFLRLYDRSVACHFVSLDVAVHDGQFVLMF